MTIPGDIDHHDFVASLADHVEKPIAQFLKYYIHYETRDMAFTKWSLIRNNFASDLYLLFTRETDDRKLRDIYWTMSNDMKDNMAVHEDEWNLWWGTNVFKCAPGVKRVLTNKCLQIEWISYNFISKY
jgi:hypothetical protein